MTPGETIGIWIAAGLTLMMFSFIYRDNVLFKFGEHLYLGVSLGLTTSGQLKLLAVASSSRIASMPKVPTIAETLPGFEAVAWYAIVAPPKTPKTIIDKVNADVNEALRQPALQEQLKKLSAVTLDQSMVRGSTSCGLGPDVSKRIPNRSRYVESLRILGISSSTTIERGTCQFGLSTM